MSKLRAVFYARVSTEEEKQLNALEKQIQENRDVIAEHGWDLVEEYVDEGKTGTTVKRRDEYKRLLEDMGGDKFDIIVAKSQDRLQRNTKDWYIFVDRLATDEKRLFLYLDNKFFTPEDDSLLTGIKAILAEEYSRELSKKINNANSRRLEKARRGETVSVYGSSKCYGYDLINGTNIINEEQARVVRLIYKLYLEGYGGRAIRRELTARGITNHDGKEMNEVTILNILKNERYIGTLVTNKSHKDFVTKRTIKNPPSEWVRIPNAVPAIVSEEDFNRVAEILDSHRMEAGTEKRGRTLGKNVGKTPLSGKIFCGNCGSIYWRKTRADNGEITWICSKYAKMGKKYGRRNAEDPNVEVDSERGCNSVTIYNRDIMAILSELSNDITIDKSAVRAEVLRWLNSLLDAVSNDTSNATALSEIARMEKKKNKLTEAYMDEIISKDDYKVKYKELEDLIAEIRSSLAPTIPEDDIEEIKRVITNVDEEIDGWIINQDFTQDKLQFIIDHVSKITVNSDCLVIELDLIAGAIVAGKDFLQYVKESRPLLLHTDNQYVKTEPSLFIHTDRAYYIPVNGVRLPVVLSVPQ
jgi:DNA invertase Pin-like site-specific DNA recombinase